MKSILLFLSLLSGMAWPVTWTRIPLGTGRTLQAVHFPSRWVGYAAGDSGQVFRTQDGGATWKPAAPLPAGPGRNIYAVHFTHPDTGWVAGSGGLFYATRDGGATWDPIDLGAGSRTASLLTLHFTGPRRGFVGGHGAAFHRTEDGGATWSRVGLSSDLSDSLLVVESVHFPAPGTGYALVTPGVAKSTDGGLTWSLAKGIQDGGWPPTRFTECHFTDSATGFLVGPYYGDMAKTTDGMRTMRIVDCWSALDVHFPTASVGYAVGLSGLVTRTSDGGETWTVETQAREVNQGDLKAVFFLDGEFGFAVGAGGALLRTGNPANAILANPRGPGSRRAGLQNPFTGLPARSGRDMAGRFHPEAARTSLIRILPAAE